MISKDERQAECVSKWRNAKGRGTLNLTFRFGKTRVADIILTNYINKNGNNKILFLVPNDITKKNINVSHVREKMGMVFQNFNLFPHLTVLENLTLAPTTLKLMSKKSANKEALKLLESIGLLDKKDEYPDNLSGGQKQRVAIIRSLIMKPKIMLFDEPTSALDPEMVSEVFDLIKKLASSGMTLIIVSHEMRFITEVSNHVIFLDDGNIIFDGTKEEMKITKNKRIKDFLKSHKK